VRLSELVRVASHDRGQKRLSDCGRPISQVPSARPEEDLAALMERLGAAVDQRVLVYDQGRLVGIVSPVDVTRILTVRQTLSGGTNQG
jgi:CBS-domain-containing membrane protein